MADIHIEEFYKDTALILLQLYNAFPRKTSVFVEDIAGPDQPDEYGVHSNRHMATLGAMLWLEEEGWLRYVDTIRQDAIDQAVLSQNAFIRLNTLNHDADLLTLQDTNSDLPDAVLKEHLTHINLIRQVLRRGSSTQIALVMQRVLFAV